MSLLHASANPISADDELLRLAADDLLKQADDSVPAYNLTGQLYLSASGWLCLAVPNMLVQGVFAAMHEPGIELPVSDSTGRLQAHISVMRPEEIIRIGGESQLRHDRGKKFSYTLGRLVSIPDPAWPGVSKVWVIRVHSPELQELRRSYGLSSLPNDGKFAFHITVALLKRGVLGRNSITKTPEQPAVAEET